MWILEVFFKRPQNEPSLTLITTPKKPLSERPYASLSVISFGSCYSRMVLPKVDSMRNSTTVEQLTAFTGKNHYPNSIISSDGFLMVEMGWSSNVAEADIRQGERNKN